MTAAYTIPAWPGGLQPALLWPLELPWTYEPSPEGQYHAIMCHHLRSQRLTPAVDRGTGAMTAALSHAGSLHAVWKLTAKRVLHSISYAPPSMQLCAKLTASLSIAGRIRWYYGNTVSTEQENIFYCRSEWKNCFLRWGWHVLSIIVWNFIWNS